MENLIIIGIIVLAVVIGIVNTVKHFKGEGGCCGGGSYKPRKKKLPTVLYRKTFRVEGMHCEHCRNRVQEAINEMQGVAGKVNLKKAEVTVSYAEDIPDEAIKAQIEKAGYKVVG